jgi:hypothetical protein
MLSLLAAAQIGLSLPAFAAGAPGAAAERMRETVRALSATEMDGRGPGSAGLARARDRIAGAFREAGLVPAGDHEGFLQPFTPKPEEIRARVAPAKGRSWGEITLDNVVGALPGSAGADGFCLVLCAHYDHLGLDSLGNAYPGADDNASGVAVLLEAAARLRAQGGFRNTILFAALSGEEEDILGAKRYVASPPCPVERTLAGINLDTVGRMERDRLFIFGVGTAQEFPSILKGVNLSVGIGDLAMPESAPFGSDQAAFYEKGVPALHLFSGPNADYHRTSDTPEKLNYEGMAKVLDFVVETAAFLADRAERLTFVPPGAEGAAKQIAPAGPARRVSLGTIPDFGRASGGVLLTGTVAGSPAEAAGLRQGDIITAIDGEAVDNLGDFSAVLKQHQPGDSVEVVFHRGEEELRRRVGLVERK